MSLADLDGGKSSPSRDDFTDYMNLGVDEKAANEFTRQPYGLDIGGSDPDVVKLLIPRLRRGIRLGTPVVRSLRDPERAVGARRFS